MRVSQQQKIKTSKTQKEITGNTGSTHQRKGILDPVPVWFGSQVTGNTDQRETIILESKKKLELLEYKMYLVRVFAKQYLYPVLGNIEHVIQGD